MAYTAEDPQRSPARAWLEAATVLCALILGACSEPTEPPPPASAIDAAELNCLALSMYWEAKAEGDRGMQAVGHVVLNRMADDRFPAKACAVVFEGGEKPPCQFSWYCDGKSDRPTEAENWATAQRLASELLEKAPTDITKGALFFHATRIKSPWRAPRTRTITIGKHVFYK